MYAFYGTVQLQEQYGKVSFAPSAQVYQDQANDDDLEELYDHLENIWDALLITLPEISEDPTKMRVHSTLEMVNDGTATDEDSLLFWPIGQVDLMCRLARRLMDENGINLYSSAQDIITAISPLAKVPWSLRHDLWKYFLLIPSAPSNPEEDDLMENDCGE